MTEEDRLTAFEARLASLKPRGANLGRDQLMFLAGQASVVYWPTHRPSAFRPALLSALVAAAVTFAAVTATESGSRIVDRVASAAASAPVSRSRPARPERDSLEYRVGVGNLPGWVVSLLVGQSSSETASAQSRPNLVQLRQSLLDESAGRSNAGSTDEGHGSRQATEQALSGKLRAGLPVHENTL